MAKLTAALSALPELEGYDVEGYVGEGGMGVVYRARQHDTGQVVALKLLSKADAAGIYRFKREFRTLANIVHPNLVRLLDLRAAGDRWFFTMDLISGMGLFDYLRVQRLDEAALHSSHTERDPSRMAAAPASRLPRAAGAAAFSPDATTQAAQLRVAFAQLVEGISVLHANGKLHCDIKPSNVMVDDSGRVVVLDFGVSRAFMADDPFRTLDELAGTPEYMSPEQASGAQLGPSSDWYSVGVVLYEALCGQLPFDGPRSTLLEQKQKQLPPRPCELNAELPADLDALCMDLLSFAAGDRPEGAELLARLAAPGMPSSPVSATVPKEPSTFIGRATELAVLQAAVDDGIGAGPAAVLLTGSSGIGKSTLLQHFCNVMSAQPGTLLLRGCCYERESVPYKALDSIIDELTRFLRLLADRDVVGLLPRHIRALTRVFPVLRRVRAIAQGSGQSPDLPALETRRRASAALRELLGRLADRYRLVLIIDDLQWGDVDSARMLLDLLEAPEPPSLCLVLGARDEASPALVELLSSRGEGAFSGLVRRVVLAELAPGDAAVLARQLLGDAVPDSWAQAIAQESRGHPFFIRELALHALGVASPARSSSGPDTPPLLEPILRARVEALPPQQRAQLELVAVASQPISELVLRHAEQAEQAVSPWFALSQCPLVRKVGRDTEPRFECYHDRVRAAVLATLSAADVARCHRNLAAAYEKSGDADPEILLQHYLGSGELERAQTHLVASAHAAAQALAFSRATQLYRLALDLIPPSRWDGLDLRRCLADALANEGRLIEAADIYELASRHASGLDAVELRRLAAQHYLTSGQSERGVALLRIVLPEVGLEYPETPAAAVLRLGLERLKLRVYGLSFKERDPSQIPAAQLAATDVCFSAAVGLAMTDLIRTAAFSALHLRLALRTGDPMRIARALTFEMGIAPGAGREGLRWANKALPVAERLSARQGSAYHHGLFFLAQGHVAYLSGQWKGAVDWLTRAEASLRDSRTPEVHWALLSSNVLANVSAVVTGDLLSVATRLPALAKEARQRADLFTLALTAYPRMVLDLARDQPQVAARNLSDLELPQAGTDLRSFTALHCSLVLDRYVGNVELAWRRLEECWPGLEQSKLLVVNIVRVTALAERGSAALSMAGLRTDPVYLRLGKDCARQLAREPLQHARALGLLLSARVQLLAGERPRALAVLTDACLQLEAAGLVLQAQCARRGMGSLIGGNMGEIIVEETDTALRNAGIRAPARFAYMMAPGFAVIPPAPSP